MTPHFPAPQDPGWTWHDGVTGRPYALPRCAWCGRSIRARGYAQLFLNVFAPRGWMWVLGWHDRCLIRDPLAALTVNSTWKDRDVRRRVLDEVRARNPNRIGPGDAWPRWSAHDEHSMNEPTPDRLPTDHHEDDR